LHIYWDGSFGICCQESEKLYPPGEQYNIKNMTMSDWFNSRPVTSLRQQIIQDKKLKVCSNCYNEEALYANSSRRLRENFKSAIFTIEAFDESFKQSPNASKFKYSEDHQGQTITDPVDLHIDLGNYCNLACKMCWAGASSTLATLHNKWGDTDAAQYLKHDWTKDEKTWTRFLNELVEIPNLKNLHFMGGETLLTKKFEEIVDRLIEHKRFDVCFSFVTNGTIFNERLIKKLSMFERVGIEVSIETVSDHNGYIRQKTNTDRVLQNIDKFLGLCNGTNMTLTIRPAISALSIGYFHTLIQYCIDKKLIIKSLIVEKPQYMAVAVLPVAVRNEYLHSYHDLINKLDHVNDDVFNESHPDKYMESAKQQIYRAISLLSKPQQKGIETLVKFCEKNDKEFGYNAMSLYPELEEYFKKHGYAINNR